jgi:hypothetical protein
VISPGWKGSFPISLNFRIDMISETAPKRMNFKGQFGMKVKSDIVEK